MHKILASLLLTLYLAPCAAGTYTATTVADRDNYINRAKASMFLSRTTFGPIMSDVQGLSNAQIQALPEDDIQNLAADIALAIANKSPGETDLDAERQAYEAWIDKQIDITPTSHRETTTNMLMVDGKYTAGTNGNASDALVYRHYTWWHIAFRAIDQLRQRMAWALSQIFVVFDSGIGGALDLSGQQAWIARSRYYDMLVNHAFGNYRNLMGDVTLDPTMGSYLSYVRNSKGDGAGQLPDENYARELMQLFTIGLYELNIDGSKKMIPSECGPIISPSCKPIDTYDNETIKQLARAFTGLSYARSESFAHHLFSWNEPMQMFEHEHDKDEKKLLNGTVLPSGQSGLRDIDDALDNLFLHPNIGPFIAKKLIQRFVLSNPSKAYVQAVAEAFNDTADNGKDRGNLEKVLKAILLHDDALTSQYYELTNPSAGVYVVEVKSKGREYLRLREPILRHSAVLRAFKPISNKKGDDNICNGCFPDDGIYAVGTTASLYKYGQIANRAPHVFNFYLPDYRPPGEISDVPPTELGNIPDGQLVAPEFEILNEVTALNLTNFNWGIRAAKIYTGPSSIDLNYVDEEAIKNDTADLLHHIDILLCNASLSDETHTMLNTIIANQTINKVSLAIQGAYLSPECAIQ